MDRRSLPSPSASPLAWGLLLALLLGARVSLALTIDDVTPLWFTGGGAFGLPGPRPADFSATVEDVRLTVTNSEATPQGDLSILQPLGDIATLGTIHQNPQTRGGTPSLSDPFIADAVWRVTNTLPSRLAAPLLIFSRPLFPPAEPDVPVAVDASLVQILRYSNDGIDYFLPAIQLPDLDPGGSTEVTVRYLVGGPLRVTVDEGGHLLHVPAFGMTALATYVPEPGSAVLLGMGLMGLARARRRRGTIPEPTT